MCWTTVTFLPRCAPSPEGIDPLSPSAELLESLGQLESWKGNYEQGVAHLKTALELYQKKGDDKGIASVLRKQVLVFYRHSRYNEAIELGSIALEKVRALGDDLGTADALCHIGCSLFAIQKREEAMLYLIEALEKFRVHGHAVGAMICLGRLASIHRMNGDLNEAWSTLRLGKANPLIPESGDTPVASWAPDKLSAGLAEVCDIPCQVLTGACDVTRQVGDRFGTCECLEDIGIIELERGRYEEAEEKFQELIALARSINYGLVLARSTAKLGETLQRQGKLSEAATALENACSLFEEISYRGTESAEAAQNLAQVKEAQGDVEATGSDLSPQWPPVYGRDFRTGTMFDLDRSWRTWEESDSE
ncbi:hypothetical protein FRC04_009330 [Tulasnella sp. 424]|nr:hypothetical protein FRC04_009330 [Tulasnella sp. 424]